MSGFVRSLSKELVCALGKLAEEKEPNWWKEILDNPDLRLAIREDSLNVYAKGQSVFKIELSKQRDETLPRLVMTTHYKYLLIPKMPRKKEYVTFDGRHFLMKGQHIDPNSLIQMSYIPQKTVSQLVRSAISHSNPEKRGVHAIAMANSNVIDLEIAFSKVRKPEPEDPTILNDSDNKRRRSSAPRMDLATLFSDDEGKARLVFYEVKRFDDGRLWGEKPPVLDQMKKYDAFLESKGSELKNAYKNVCKLLLKLQPNKDLPHLISEVALGLRRLEIDKASRLVIIGFDRDQRKGRLKELKSVLKARGLTDNRLITRGSPNGLELR